MDNRWKMNRIGFVNFWLYDEEYFDFYDGKLLLRGQNGSGKSITTQSFIPFILDGDRTPSRLDPFGSSDRRMEYYFLGEEGRDEATGYLFLEFKKEHTEEYRTIGIGQRAKRGKPMDFWGFIILDGRRIGYELWLYKETGSTKIPHTKRDMKAVIGEENLFTDSQSEYKKLVNQYIFGFRKAEQYEQFIKLLVKVRAPKLSKEFKPTKVYDILNESLQTLSDEDLRTMVDAMEKMDEIQDSLDMLNRAFSDVKIIRNEYTRYNQYMLAKKAQAYLNKKEDVEKSQQEYDEQQEKKQEICTEMQNIKAQLADLSEKKQLAETARNSLLDTDLEEMDRKLQDARNEKKEAEEKEQNLARKIRDCKERIYRREQELKNIKQSLEDHQEALLEQKQELEECQNVLQWEEHETVIRIIGMEQRTSVQDIFHSLFLYKKRIDECKSLIHQYEEISRKYDEIAEELDMFRKAKLQQEDKLVMAKQKVETEQDNWIINLYETAKNAKCWKPDAQVLKEAETQILEYQNIADAGKIMEVLRKDYEKQSEEFARKKLIFAHQAQIYADELEKARIELVELEQQKEIEPDRSEERKNSRKNLEEAGIEAVPFYKAVEFSEILEDSVCAQLEAQLEQMGLLDALVVADGDLIKIKEVYPEILDHIIYAPQMGTSDFVKLKPAEHLNKKIRESICKILSNIYEKPGAGHGIYLGKNGQFLQGLLAGRATKDQAEFLGYLVRKKAKEQRIEALKREIEQKEANLTGLHNKIQEMKQCMEILHKEYTASHDFDKLNRALEAERNCVLELERILIDYQNCELKERECVAEKQAKYQSMLQKCKGFPYGRTETEYQEVLDVIEEYLNVLQNCKELLLKTETERSNLRTGQDYLEQDEQSLDEAFVDQRNCNTKIKECKIRIHQYEEYMNRPEIVERAKRLKTLQEEIEQILKKIDNFRDQNIRLDESLNHLMGTEPQKKVRLQELIAEETILRKFFEEELSLKLILDRESRTLAECAKIALGTLRDSDKNREYGDMLQSLIQVYQKHNGSLTNYGTSLEDCFDVMGDVSGVGDNFHALRRRVRVVSAWNGKKVYLEEFYCILKKAIEETELLIQQKDRELFEDILSQTISQQLTDRIAESRRWVKDMSQLMKNLDTSMGLSFSLEWKPRGAENDAELDTIELEKILLRDHELLTMEDIEKVAGHFRSKIRNEKMKLEENGSIINYMELVRDALDYRKWFEFRMFYKRGEDAKKPLTNAAFNRFSGGEKAMAMYVPLFAAVNAQYKKAESEEHPRIIALDEAFAGVDDKNIRIMFDLVQKMDFDYIMNSQSLWGCYDTVNGVRIAELHRPMNSQIVTIIRYLWNGHERILDEQ